MIHILNGPKDGFEGVYIGRPGRGRNGSPLANPFVIGRDGDRAAVIAKYRQWLWARVKDRSGPQWAELNRIAAMSGEVRLVCFCAPLPCHGDVVKAAVEWIQRTR